MKVKSKLANVDFLIGSIERKESTLVISSDPSQPMRSKVYVTPQDVTLFLRKLFMSPSGLLFILGLPVFYFRSKRKNTHKRG